MNPDDLRKRLSQRSTSNPTPTEPESPISGASRAQALLRRFGAETQPETQEPLPWQAPGNVPAAAVPARMTGVQLPARSSGDGGFAVAARSPMATTSDIVGTIMPFRRDGFYTGHDISVPLGTLLVVTGMKGPLWKKWWGGKEVDRREGSPLPPRSELGDHDPSKWEIGPNGQPKDPWQLTRYTYLTDLQTGESFTFPTTSWGGSEAVRQLAVHVEMMRRDAPDALPVIALGITVKKSKKWGPVPAPLLEVKGWVGADLRPLPLGVAIDDSLKY
jgi:hypothetical protein